MFTVLNSQFTYDDKLVFALLFSLCMRQSISIKLSWSIRNPFNASRYLFCVSEHMNELKPFGDVPDKLSVQIKRSFVATRTFAHVLTTGAEVLKKAMNVSTMTKAQSSIYSL